jgi:hypothetical protein
MSRIIKATMVTFVIMILIVAGFSAMAARPIYTGLKCPPAVDGQTGSVTGRVTASMNTTGVVGAYIAIVNASNVSQEYFNTTSGADGYYQFVGVNASYNATNVSDVGPNGATPYKIYANMSYGEGYSAAFGVDASGGSASPATGVSPISVDATPTPTPSPTAAATPSPSPAPTSTPEPTVMPATATAPPPTATPQTPILISPALPLLIAAFIAIVVTRRTKN